MGREVPKEIRECHSKSPLQLEDIAKKKVKEIRECHRKSPLQLVDIAKKGTVFMVRAMHEGRKI